MFRNSILLLCFVAVLCGGRRVTAQVNFKTQIAPILERHCLKCHSPANKKGDISLATIEDLRSNEYVRPGDPGSSYVSGVDPGRGWRATGNAQAG